MQFKIDENLPAEMARLLRDLGHSAHTIVDEEMRGAADADVATACREERRCLITLDLDFADVRTYHHG